MMSSGDHKHHKHGKHSHHKHHHGKHSHDDSAAAEDDHYEQDVNNEDLPISAGGNDGDGRSFLQEDDSPQQQQQHKKIKVDDSSDDSRGWTYLLKYTTAKSLLHMVPLGDSSTAPSPSSRPQSPAPKELVTIQSGEPISRLLKLLTEHNLLSLPVVNQNKEFLGFVDSLDVAGYVLASWRKHSAALEQGKFPAEEFFETSIEKILDFSHVDPSVVVSEDTSVLDLIDIFSDPRMHLRLHRLAVVNASRQLIGIVSQSKIISFVHSHIKDLPKEMETMRIKDMGMTRSLIFVMVDSPFIDTLETLYRNRISGLALLNDQFQLAGNISTSDLRGLSPNSFNYFLGSTLQFLVKGRKGEIKPPLSVSPETTLPKLLDILVKNKIHRVYVSDPNGRPHSLVTLGDIIARLI